MWPFSKPKPDVILHKKEIIELINAQCRVSGQYRLPNLRNKWYKLIPDTKWVLDRTIKQRPHIDDFFDCSHMALAQMAKLQERCCGIAVCHQGPMSGTTTHELNIIILEDETVLYFDPATRHFTEPKFTKYTIVRLWL